MGGVGGLEVLEPLTCQLPFVVVHEDGDAVVEIGVETVLHGVHLLKEEVGRLVGMPLFDEKLGPDVDDFLVVLFGDGVDDVACLVELPVVQSLPGKEDLRVDAVRVHVDCRLDGLVGFGVLLARHVIFGNIGQLVRLHIRRLPLCDCLFVAMKQPQKMPRLIVLVAVFHSCLFNIEH